jgi:ubiquitin-protein ligase E3 C
MLPVFDDNRRRRINLGGNSSATTHAAILDQAKARRSEREQNRKRNESAVRLQAWWRGLREVRGVRHELRTAFENDITGITGMRCLVLLGTDDEALGIWSRAMVSSGHGQSILSPPPLTIGTESVLIEVLFHLAKGSDRSSWIVLVRQVTLLLLRSVAKSPRYAA